MKRSERSVMLDLLLGAAAGAAATWVMDRVTTVIYEHEDEDTLQREKEAQGDQPVYVVAAEKAADSLGLELNEQQKQVAGSAIHWGLGVGGGMVYGVVRHAFPRLGPGFGIAFGTVWWAAMDEGANTLLGLAPPPPEFPWQTHARGLVGHLTLGAVLDVAFLLADAAEG